MPVVLTNAPSTFQRVLEQCMGDLHLKKCLLFIDDIVVFSKTPEEHFQHLREVLGRLRMGGMKLKPSKCHFLRHSVNYLGHVISEQGVQTDPEKVKDVLKWKIPESVEDVRRFLGFTGFYRRFVQNYSSIAHVLTNLLVGDEKSGRRKGRRKCLAKPVPFLWDKDCQNAFDQLKDKMTSAPILAYADFSLPFELHIDASLSGLGAVLYQTQCGQKRVIAYASRGLSRSEKNYPIHKLEFLALKWSVCQKFHDYLYGSHFEVFTDNNPLTYILTTAKLDATGHRWLAELSTYNFSIAYVAGRNNTDADSLSRLPQEAVQAICQSQIANLSFVDSLCFQVDVVEKQGTDPELDPDGQTLTTPVNIVEDQLRDSVIGNIVEWVKVKYKPSFNELKSIHSSATGFLRVWDNLFLKDGILYRKKMQEDGNMIQLVLPNFYRSIVLHELHDNM